MKTIKGAKGGKGGGGGYSTPRPPINSLHSVAYAKVIDVISEGEIQGLVGGAKSIYFDGTPMQNEDGTYNFEGVSIESTYGTPEQAALVGFDSAQNEISTNNVEITRQTTAGHSGPAEVALYGSKIDKAYIRIRIPELYKTNRNTGKNLPFTLEFNIYKKKLTDASWTPVYTAESGGVINITGVTTATYERQIEVELNRAHTWMIKVERITPDKDELEAEGATETKKFDHKCTSILSGITVVTEARLRYPDTAYVALKVDASQFGDSVPERAFLVDGIKVKIPVGYDPVTRTYSAGVWAGDFQAPQWTNNPAWILRHLLTNTRYGCGIQEEYIDDAELYAIAKYCDELVPSGLGDGLKEPRFTINTVLGDSSDVVTAITQITSVFRGMAYWSSNSITTVCDKPSDVVAIVTKANVVNGEFNYSSTSLRERHSVALVSWNDPESEYKSQIEIVEDPESVELFGWKTVDLKAFGCTSRGQAHRLGKWLLYSERVESETVSYEAGQDHFALRPGDIISISDPSKDGARYGGRVVSSNQRTVELDNYDDVSVSDTIHIVNQIGQIKEYHVVSKAGGVLTLNKGVECEPGAVWQSIPSTLTNLPQYRVLSVAENNEGTYKVTAHYHDPNKYALIEDNLHLPTVTVKKANFLPKPPKSISFSESLELNNNTIQTKLYVSWEDDDTSEASRPVKWNVRYRKDGGNWISTDVSVRTLTITDIADGEKLDFHVRAKSLTGKTSNKKASASYTIIGKSYPPQQVTNFTSTIIRNSGVLLSWSAVPDVDLDHYIIRTGSLKTSAVVYSGPDTKYLIPSSSKFASDTTLYIWAVDTSGNESSNYAQLNIVYSKAVTPVVTLVSDTSSDSNAFFKAKWNDVSSTSNFDIKHYRVVVSLGSTTIHDVTLNSTDYRFQVTTAGTYTASVSAVDIFGQQTLSGSASLVCSAPSAPTSLAISNDNGRLHLGWTTSTGGTLPVKGYIVSTSSTQWTGSSVVYRGNSTSRDVTNKIVNASSTLTFYIRAFDNAGNQSSTASVVYTGSGITAPSNITTKTADTSKTTATVKFKWTASSSVFPVERYEVVLSKAGVELERSFVNATEWTTNIDWTGTATFSVKAIDAKGTVSAAATKDFTNSPPNQVPSVVVEAVSATTTKISLRLDWEAPAKTTLPIAGYEVRNSDSGWGGTGAVYRGAASACTVTRNISSIATDSVYLRAFDTEGQYSTTQVVSLSTSVKPSAPTNVTVSYIRNQAIVSYTGSVSIGQPVYTIKIGGVAYYTGVDNPAALTIVNVLNSTVTVTATFAGVDSDPSTSVPIVYSVGSPTAVTTTVLNKRKLKVSWTAPASVSAGLSRYYIEAGQSTYVTQTVRNSTHCLIEPEWVGVGTINVYAIDNNGVKSSAASVSYTVVPPTAIPGAISSNLSNRSSTTYNLNLDWDNASEGTFAIDGYDIRATDTNWNYDLSPVKRVKPSSASFKVSSNVFTYYIRPFDKFGNYAATSVSVSKDGVITGAFTNIKHSITGQETTVSWGVSGEVDLDIKKFEVINDSTGVKKNLGDTPRFSESIKSTTTYTLKAYDYNERSVSTSYTVTIVNPTLTAPTISFVSAASVVVGTVTTPYQKIKVDFSTPTCTFPIATYTILRKRRGTNTWEVMYEGNANTTEVLAYPDITTDFKAYATDVVGNKSSELVFAHDVIKPGTPSSCQVKSIGSNRMRMSVSYNAPKDFRNFSYILYKFDTAKAAPLADGSNWDTVKLIDSGELLGTSQTYDYQMIKKWGGKVNTSKTGVKYGVKVVVYDTSGNSSNYRYSPIKVVKLV